MTGSHEVTGSIPVSSTNSIRAGSASAEFIRSGSQPSEETKMKRLTCASAALALMAVFAASIFAGDFAAGKEVYKAQKCSMCHQIGGEGGKMGGLLDNVGNKRDAEWLKKYIKDPKAVEAKSKMKAYPGLSDKELDDLVAYMLTLKAELKK